MAGRLCICFFLLLIENQVASSSTDSLENDEASLLQLLNRSTIVRNQKGNNNGRAHASSQYGDLDGLESAAQKVEKQGTLDEKDAGKLHVNPLPPGSLGGAQPPPPGYITTVVGTPRIGSATQVCEVDLSPEGTSGIHETLGSLGGAKWHPVEQTLYYAAMNVVRKIDPETGTIVTLAGRRGACTGNVDPPCFEPEECANPGDGGSAFDANFKNAHGIEFNLDTGGLYIVDSMNHAIRYIDPETNIITSVVGQAGKNLDGGYAGDGGPATEALMNYPHGLERDQATGDLYIPDMNNGAVRVVDGKTGIISSLWKAEGLQPARLQVVPRTQGGLDIYIADFACCVHKVDSITGSATTLVGQDADLGFPAGAQYDITTGDLYVSGWVGSTIKKVDGKTGVITTIAGRTGEHMVDETAAMGYPVNTSLGLADFGDDGPMENALFGAPADLTWVPERRWLFIGDDIANNVRLIQL